MKRLLAIILGTATLVGCSKNNFTLEGTLANYDKEVVYLQIGGGFDATPIVVEAKVKDGKFVAKANLSQPYSAVLLDTEEPDYSQGQPKYISLVVEPGTIVLNADWESGRINSATGSEQFALALEMERAAAPLMNEMQKLQADRTPENEAKIRELFAQYNDIEKEFTAKHPYCYTSVSKFSAYTSEKSVAEMEEYYNSLPAEVKEWKEAKEIIAAAELRRSLEPGNPAPVIGGTDINGNPFSLDQLKGSYILVDFWASWCRPCRASNPHVKELYEKYKDKGFEVVYVADDDSNEEAWRNAVEQDGLQEFHHILRGLKRTESGAYDRSNDQSDKYDVHYLPTKYLIDSDFNIIGKVDDQSLEEELKKAFGF
ncbi:MAG: AhpC/TSA family protein [Rikenellaceae bacterium]|nr:AhpC/TSA family protein [Rikenellaceae bacterium]